MSILVSQSSPWGRESWLLCLALSSWCLVIVVWLFLTMTQGSLQFMIVVFPDYIHYVLVPMAWEDEGKASPQAFTLFAF